MRKILNAVSGIIKPKKLFSLPVQSQIEITTFCNLSCASCPRKQYVERPKNMSFKNFVSIVEKLNSQVISLSGLGEVIMNPEIFNMISYANKRGNMTVTTSNFTLITDEHIDNFINSGLSILNISVDAASQVTYLKIRTQDNFNKVITNIKKLSKRKSELGVSTPLIRLCFVIQEENLDEMISFYHLAKEVGANLVEYQPYAYFDSEKIKNGEKIDLLVLFDNIKKIIKLEKSFKEPKTNAGILKRKINILNDHYNCLPTLKIKKCISPWTYSYITIEGEMRPCCMFQGVSYSMGNINDVDDPMTVFNNEHYKEFRKKLRSNVAPHELCIKCINQESIGEIVRRKYLKI